MFNLITLHHFGDKPEARARSVSLPGGGRLDLLTYGHHLIDEPSAWSGVDRDLRVLVAGCLEDRQARRPPLERLLERVVAGVKAADARAAAAKAAGGGAKTAGQQGFSFAAMMRMPHNSRPADGVEDDALIERFFRNYFRDAPPNMDPYDGLWQTAG
ncbi:hypothetical protein GGR56DRAFT_241523 [Xylariaceae sp. FL0804]|nr:hypothetical protein GGR56DRAFT_241523 [Xylariaceae sp. FL0804]